MTNRRIKVAIISNTSWSLFNFRLELARSIKNTGYEVVLIAPKDEYSERLSKEFEYHNIWINNKGVSPKEDIRVIIDFYKLYKKIKPNIVLHYTIKPNIYGSIAANLLGIRFVNNISGLGRLFIKQGFITNIVKILYKFSQARASCVFFQNSDDLELFIKHRLVPKERVNLLPGSGVCTTKYIPIEKKTSKKIVFLLIARMIWEKGLEEYIEAAKIIKKKYNNVEFQMAGFLDVDSGSAIPRAQMQKWVDEGIVNYLGSSDNIEKIIARADCIVLPSFYREGVPRTLLESASMAKPIITTNNVGCKDVVDDGVNGYLCEIRNAKDLSFNMEKMLNLSYKERKLMGEYGRMKMIKEFDEKIVINKYIEVIETL